MNLNTFHLETFNLKTFSALVIALAASLSLVACQGTSANYDQQPYAQQGQSERLGSSTASNGPETEPTLTQEETLNISTHPLLDEQTEQQDLTVDTQNDRRVEATLAPELKVTQIQTHLTIPAGKSAQLLGDEGKRMLGELVAGLNGWSNIDRVVITGHTDSEGSDTSNEKFSLKRANAVASKLQELGLTDVEFEIIGEGEQSPIADNKSIEGRALNRRVEIEVEGRIEHPAATETAEMSDLLQAANP